MTVALVVATAAARDRVLGHLSSVTPNGTGQVTGGGSGSGAAVGGGSGSGSGAAVGGGSDGSGGFRFWGGGGGRSPHSRCSPGSVVSLARSACATSSS